MSDPLTIDALNAMDRVEIARRLSAPPGERAAFLAAAAGAGLAEAQAVYGQMLLDGVDVAQDRTAGFGWFVRAAKQGHVLAVNMVGRCYDQGWGVAVDKAEAARWFEEAAARGLDWGLYNFATALALGEGVAEDRPRALALFRQAAAMGNAKAINHIGSFYEDGWVVDRDMEQAADHYRRAAEGGDFRGQFNHARMLIEAGRAGEAQPWIDRAIAGGNLRFAAQVRDWLAARPA